MFLLGGQWTATGGDTDAGNFAAEETKSACKVRQCFPLVAQENDGFVAEIDASLLRMTSLDSFDRAILALLQRDGRLPNAQLAEKVGL